ncbi:MAG: TonB-dependent receptor domain-containing protein [Salibacteraceae bacterium]
MSQISTFFSLKKLYFTLLLFVGCLCSMAQPGQGGPPGRQRPSFQVSGQVTDASDQLLPYANVVFYRLRDSSLALGGATDETGKFDLKVPAGMYYVEVSFLSLESTLIPKIMVRGGPQDLGTVVLKAKASTLNEVTVVAEKSDVELQVDKRVFNVGKDLQNAGGSAAEMLDNLPSIEVDPDGNVALRGSQNVRILINGKPSGLIGTSPADALRQLPAELIEKVEIITNPSARYEAEGEVGIINIVMRKNDQPGTNGSISINGGYPEQAGVALNFNFRKKRINWFVGGGVNYRNQPGTGESFQRFFADSIFSYERDREHLRGGFSGNLRAGADIDLHRFHSITISGLSRISRGDNESVLRYRDFDANRFLIAETIRDETEIDNGETWEMAFNYTRTFPKKDRKWTTDITYTYGTDIETGDLTETRRFFGPPPPVPPRPPLQQLTDNDTYDQRWLFQSDYIHPLSKGWLVESGVRYSFRELDNDFLVSIRQPDGDFAPLPAFDNRFIYSEHIYAGYLQMKKEWDKLGLQFGLRGEYTDIGIEIEASEPVNPKEYFNWFPSANLSYKLSPTQSVQFSYSRRISRPRYRNLLPFFSYSDNRNFFSGNPDLDPEFTQSLEATWLLRWPIGTLLSSVYYRYRTDVFQRVSTADTNGFISTFPINIGTQDAYGLEWTTSYSIKRWWRISGNANFFRAITQGEFEGTSLDADAFTWTTRFNSRWSYHKKNNFQASWLYRAPRETPQGRSLSLWSLDLSLSRELLKGKGTLSANVRDLFNTRKRRSITETDRFYSESEFQWRTRQFRLSFTYRINQQNRKRSGNSNRSSQSWGDEEF